MKSIIFMSAIIGILYSCDSNSINPENSKLAKFNPEDYPQKWQLIEMSGNDANVPPFTGSEMSWQEYYLLNSDNTFVKSRDREDVVAEETGTFTFVILTDGTYLELVYESNNDLLGNCYSDFKELLKLNSENKLVGTWSACDGPGLIYERTE